jgi:hypothetical protein
VRPDRPARVSRGPGHRVDRGVHPVGRAASARQDAGRPAA